MTACESRADANVSEAESAAATFIAEAERRHSRPDARLRALPRRATTTMGVKIVEASSVNAGDSETLDAKVMAFSEACLAKVKAEGAPAVYAYAGQFGELAEGQSAVVDKAAMKAAYDGLDAGDRACLEACGGRIKAFALAQKASFVDMETPIPGGVAGHTVSPVEVAGCYAPGGRYPLPSSVLMTAVTARAAGVKTVVVATPKPLPVTLAAAHVAGADVLVAVGGAHAIAAMATGCVQIKSSTRLQCARMRMF